jgi:hypothetical protein
VKNRKRFGLISCIFVSLLLHASTTFILHPIVDRKPTPTLVGWLDLLSSADLAYRSASKKKFPQELLSSRVSILSFCDYSPFSYPPKQRIVFKGKVPDGIVKKKHTFIFLEKETPPLINLVNFESKSLTYKVGVCSRGKVLLATPLTLPINSSISLWLEKYLRESIIFVEKNNFFWTKIEVMIK